jgi:aspartyl-tRNA(Asn)/glutamyl-tRNA(Gln) amidotransferase subunit A
LKFDLLLGPVMPCGAPELVRDAPDGFEPGDWRWCPFTYLWNMTGQPAASVPWGPGPDGQPIGVQCVGRIGAEPDILRAASALQAAWPAPMRPSTLLAHVNKAA